jgi:hypothetical protein
MHRSQTVSVSIAVDPARAYAYVADPANLPAWAAGFVYSIARREDQWLAQTPLGEATFRFVPPNRLGVVDHDVEIGAERFHNPMRIIPNGYGSEVLFTLLQLPEVTDEQFARDASTVLADLRQLKKVLESRYGSADELGVAARGET